MNAIFRNLNQKSQNVELQKISVLITGGELKKELISKTKTEKFLIPIYSNGKNENALQGYTLKPKVKKPAITISARGTIGFVALRNEPFFPIVSLITILPKENVNIEFLKYFLENLKLRGTKGGVPMLTLEMIKNIKISLPPLQIQEKIANNLDVLNVLAFNDLPKEIALRKQQFQYYLNRIFEALNAK